MGYLFGYEGFENGNKGTFDQEQTWGGGTLSYDSGSLIDGTYTLKSSMSAAGEGTVKEDLGASYETLFIQFKIHLPSGWSFDTGTYFGIMNVLDSSNNNLIGFSIEDWNGYYRLTSWSSETEDWRDIGESVAVNNTYKIEVKLVKKASGGEIKIWVNNDTEGSPDYSFSGDVGDTDIDKILIGNTYSDGSHDPVYYDSVIISQTFIGARAIVTQINIGDDWKEIEGMKINIGDVWKTVEGLQVNIGDDWKTVF